MEGATMTLDTVLDCEIFDNADVAGAHFVDHRTIVVFYSDGSSGVLLRSPYSGWYWHEHHRDAATATGMYDA